MARERSSPIPTTGAADISHIPTQPFGTKGVPSTSAATAEATPAENPFNPLRVALVELPPAVKQELIASTLPVVPLEQLFDTNRHYARLSGSARADAANADAANADAANADAARADAAHANAAHLHAAHLHAARPDAARPATPDPPNSRPAPSRSDKLALFMRSKWLLSLCAVMLMTGAFTLATCVDGSAPAVKLTEQRHAPTARQPVSARPPHPAPHVTDNAPVTPLRESPGPLSESAKPEAAIEAQAVNTPPIGRPLTATNATYHPPSSISQRLIVAGTPRKESVLSSVLAPRPD